MMFGNQAAIFQSAFPDKLGDGDRPAPMGSFAWGAGGARLTPEQLALRQKQALIDQQVDTSPVGHWTEGLARVANNIAGAFEQRNVDRQSALLEGDRQQSIAALLAPQGAVASGGANPVAQALLSHDPAVQKLGMARWERDNPKPRAPSAFEELGALGGLTPEQIRAGAAQKFNNEIDPLVNFVVGGNTVVGPRSLVGQQFGGGQTPSASVSPPLPAIERLRANPSEASQFDQIFGPGAAQRVLGGG